MIFIILCLAAEAVIFAYLIYMLAKFKKLTLKTTAVYPILVLIAVLIIFVGELKFGAYEYVYQAAIFAFSNALSLVTMSIDEGLLELFRADTLYLIAYVGVYILSFLSLMSIGISLVVTFFKNLFLFNLTGKQTTYVVNLTEETKAFLSGLDKKQKRHTIVLLPGRPDYSYVDEKLFCSRRNVKYQIVSLEGRAFDRTMRLCTLFRKMHKYAFVVSAAKDDELYRLTVKIVKYVKEKQLYDFSVRFVILSSYQQNYFLRDLIQGNPSGIEVVNAKGKRVLLLDESRGVITCLDKYETIAYDFITKHNFAKYFPPQYQNPDGTIQDVEMNLYLLGFGKVNRYLLRDILIVNQFVTVDGNHKLQPKQMRVHVYDTQKESEVDLSLLANGIYKYRKADFRAQEYFDLPEDYYSQLTMHFEERVSNLDFFNDIRADLEKSQKPTVNYFLVSLGSDLQNVFVAKSLSKYLGDMEGTHNNTIFVRAKKKSDLPFFQKENVIPFGADQEVLSYETVVRDAALNKAKIQSLKYQGVPVTEENLSTEWATLSPLKRMSNVYAVASIPFKLACLGISGDLPREEYLQKYNPKGNGLRPIGFLAEPHDSFEPRDVLAFMEHCRWNAYEMSQGVLPKKKEGLETGVFFSKSDDELRHMNLASQAGLTEFYDYVTRLNEKYGTDYTADVVQYDYQLMDNYKRDEAVVSAESRANK